MAPKRKASVRDDTPPSKAMTGGPLSDCIHGLCASVFLTFCLCAKVCKWCRRSFGIANPIPGRDGCLPNAKCVGRICDCCRNTLAWYYKCVDQKALFDEVQDVNGQPYKDFMEKVAQWEQGHGDDSGERPAKRMRLSDSLKVRTRSAEVFMPFQAVFFTGRRFDTLLGWPAQGGLCRVARGGRTATARTTPSVFQTACSVEKVPFGMTMT